MKRFAPVFAPKARPKRPQGVNEPHQEEAPRDGRSDVLRVLSFGQPADPAEIPRALTDSLDDFDDLDPPLVLLSGVRSPLTAPAGFESELRHFGAAALA